jgi:TrmH family RNA methyltransferase
VSAASEAAQQLADRIVVVLVQPLQPGNVGATARAMKNFGLRRLVLVDPPSYDPEQARWMAPGCGDLLAEARIVATLDEALEGVHRAIATTARHRRSGQRVYEPRQVAEAMYTDVEHDPSHTTAILFGREDFGLSADDVRRCEGILRIPTPEHASLNLAQAVLLVAHSLFEVSREHGARATGRTLGGSRSQRSTASARPTGRRTALADAPTMEPAIDELVALLDRVGYLRGTPAHKVQLTARQALQNARVTVKHVEALRGMVNKVQWALDHPDADTQAPRKR